jgi:ATP-dependent DNA helicase DinG
MGEDANDYLARRAKYVEEITKRMFVLMRVAQGNTFVLFTSQKEMLEAQAQLEVYNKSPKNKVPLEFIAQGDNPALTLRRFMETPNGVLLGLKSFWEGVDVQGDKLRLVVIPKLPFAPPNDPVLMAKERLVRARALERKESVDPGALFQQLQVPPMITNMRQAAGRLIRSKSDRGVCAILDPRIWTGSSSKKPYATQTAYYGYGKTLVTALGFPGRTSVLNDAQLFLHWIATNPNA